MRVIALAIVLYISITPAKACHHYREWYYPTPQHCYSGRSTISRLIIHPVLIKPVQPYVPLFVLPDMTATWEYPGLSKELYDEMKRKRAILQMEKQ